MVYNTARFLGYLYILIGLILLIYGLSYFLIPLSAIVVGLLLLNHGLRLNHISPVMVIKQIWRVK